MLNYRNFSPLDYGTAGVLTIVNYVRLCPSKDTAPIQTMAGNGVSKSYKRATST